jgi:hypothetical protein
MVHVFYPIFSVEYNNRVTDALEYGQIPVLLVSHPEIGVLQIRKGLVLVETVPFSAKAKLYSVKESIDNCAVLPFFLAPYDCMLNQVDVTLTVVFHQSQEHA